MRKCISFSSLVLLAILISMPAPLVGKVVEQDTAVQETAPGPDESYPPVFLTGELGSRGTTAVVYDMDSDNPLGLFSDADERDADEGRGCSASTPCSNGSTASCSCPGAGSCQSVFGVGVTCLCQGAPSTVQSCP